MGWKAVFRLLAVLIILLALSMIFPLGIAFFCSEWKMIRGFGVTALLASAVAVVTLLLAKLADLLEGGNHRP